MIKTAQVLANLAIRSIDKPYTYLIPENLSYITVGFRVIIPFGGRNVEGFIVEINSGMVAEVDKLKAIIDALDDKAWFEDNMLSTAKWLSEYYLSSMAEAMRLFIPGKASIKTHKTYIANEATVGWKNNQLFEDKPDEYVKIYEYVQQQGSAAVGDIEKKFPNSIKILNRLVSNKLLLLKSTEKSTAARPLWRMTVRLTPEAACFLQSNKLVAEYKPAQIHFMQEISRKEYILLTELSKYSITRASVNKLEQAGLVVIEKRQVIRDSYSHLPSEGAKHTLTIDQQVALEQIALKLDNRQFASFLLHGITGSGKTEVYIEAVAKVLSCSRTAIVMVPEIALTGQIVARFKQRFQEDVVVLHSRLSPGERRDTWERIREGSVGIVIGARSAVFSPVTNIGIVIIDEEHEFTYKQEETPRYHTREVALCRAKIDAAVVVLGSATPAIETYYQALKGRHILLNMLSRVEKASLPKVSITDMRDELKNKHKKVISRALKDLLIETIAKGEQAVILLNRRGYSTFIMCRECGHVLKCRHCSTTLVYHVTDGSIRCHYCGYSQNTPDECPKCKSTYIRYFGTGTQKVEEELKAIIPGARIARMDQDTTRGKMAYDRILNGFADGDFDVLLGTQMVAKGHDIKNVTAVGIITADSILNIPDFRAAERVFALLTQAAGRAGRGIKPGKVIVQTYNPEHYAIQAGAQQDYLSFYQEEVNCRQELFYPPFSNIIKFVVYSHEERTAWTNAGQLAQELQQLLADISSTELIGPFSSTVLKVKDIYRINILIKSQNTCCVKKRLKDIIKKYNDIIIDVDPISVI